MPERPRVLQMGPDPAIGGGMAAALRSLLESPLGAEYELAVVPTYRGTQPLSRLLVFLAALLRLTVWSLRGRGRVVHVHMTVRGSSLRKSVVVIWAKALRRRVVLQVHSGAGDIANFRASLGGAGLRLVEAGFARADRVLAVSEASAAALRAAYGLTEIEVVPNPAPVVAPFTRPPSPAEGPEAAYLGGFANPAKGGDVLVAALASRDGELPLRVTMAGPGEPPPEAGPLLAGDGVAWAGWLDPAAKDRVLRDAEIFVMSSRSEGMPMALLEAMAYGMTIVATRVGGIPEVLEDGVEGLLVEPEDPAALATALDRLAADPEERARFAAAARARAERLDAVEVAGRLGRIYAALG